MSPERANVPDYQTPDRGWCGDPKRGAAMGRASDLPLDFEGPVTLRAVPIDSGGYDPGGTYWGTPEDLWCVADDEGRVAYFRAPDPVAARAKMPRATFRAELQPGDLEDFLGGYVRCALWSSIDGDEGKPLDDDHDETDLAPETLATMRADCERFVNANAETLVRAIATGTGRHCTWSGAGHDFWLTSNGHGAGFGDGDWPEAEDDALYEAAHDFGQTDLYVGDDGRIYS